MKHTDGVGLDSRTVHSIIAQKVNATLTEHDILFLQDAFLVNGFHSIYAANPSAGRSLILSFLRSLPLYTNNACLTVDNTADLSNIVDIYEKLDMAGLDEQAIEDFFINEFYFDFVWIEISDTLNQEPWFGHFIKILESYSSQVPIIKVYFL